MILRCAPTLALILVVGGFVWWVMDLRAQNATLTRQNAAQAASLATMTQRASLARAAAVVAQKERARATIAAAKYEMTRDAFRKGDFNAPLPDDFRHLVLCLLRKQVSPAAAPDCPGSAR